MALTINTNVASLNAQRNLGKTQNLLNKSLQRLSSGLRINSAKDDSAGLAIANRMVSQIRGLDQAVRNANDGISLSQTAEGALAESSNILQRIRELAVQSSSDGSTDADRASMQIEVAQLIQELDRIADTTSFNGQVLLDGNFGTAQFQVGAQAGESVAMTLSSAKTNALGASGGVATGDYTMATDISDAGSLVTAGSMAVVGAGELSLNGTEIRATISGDDTVSTTDNSGSSIALAAAINASSGTTGVNAYAEKTDVDVAIALAGATLELDAGDFQINGISIDSQSSAVADVDALETLINEFSDETGVTALNNGDGTFTFTAIDGRNIQFTSDIAIATGTNFTFDSIVLNGNAYDKAVRGTVSLYSNEAFTVAGTNPGDAGFSTGTIALDETHWLAIASDFDTLALGELVINGYNVKAPTAAGDANGGKTISNLATTEEASAKAIAFAINDTDGLKSEVTAVGKTVANFGSVSAYDATAATGNAVTLTINGQAVTLTQKIEANDADGYMVGRINSVLGAVPEGTSGYGLVASINDDNELIITSDDGVNIDVTAVADLSGSAFLSNVDTTVATQLVHKGTIALTAKTGYSVSSIDGGKQALAGIETAVGTIEKLSVATYAGAQNAITAVDGALAQIDNQRASLGAIQNRFDSTIANLSNVSENLSAARARIMDADFAAETAALTRAQIMQQAGTAMLAQANQLPQAALSLLQ